MKISTVVIAHNEQQSIKACLGSLTHQTRKLDEIVLVAHNCTDETATIAKSFSNVRLVELQGREGIPYARQRSLDEARGDIVLCADGDSVYEPN